MEDELMKQFKIREAWRKRKRIVIASVPAAFVILLIILIVILAQPAPTCFDNKKNGGEEGVDCGGPCVPCGIKYAAPLGIVSSEVLGASPNINEMVVKIRNSNADYGAKFSYQINFISRLGEKLGQINGQSFILPHSDKYLIEPKISFAVSELSRLEVAITKTDWYPITKSGTDLFDIYDKSSRLLPATESGYLEVAGKIINKTSHDFPSVELTFIVYSKTGRLLYAAQSEISNLKANEIRNFLYNGFPYFSGFQELDLNRIEFLAEAWPD